MSRSMKTVMTSPAPAVCVTACTSRGSGSDKPASSSGPEPSGDPVEIATVVDTPSIDLHRPAVVAAVADVNAHGGIKGRPLQDTGCETKNSSSNAAQCSRDAVSHGAIADVGSSDNVAAASLPVPESAGLVRFGRNPYTQADFTSPASFPLVGGGLAVTAGEAASATVGIPLGAPDVSAQVAAATEGNPGRRGAGAHPRPGRRGRSHRAAAGYKRPTYHS